jgi:hypothetical protein
LTVNHTTIQTFAKRNTPWRVTVSASGTNVINGASTIPVSQMQMQVTNSTITDRPLITLSTTAQTLAADAAVTSVDKTTGHTINYILAGGANLLKSSGNYTTTLTFTMTLY